MKAEKIEIDETQHKAHKRILQNEIKNLKEQQKQIKDGIPLLEETVEIQQSINLLDSKVGEIMLTKFKKLNHDYEYEKDKEFQELMLEKQKLMIKQNQINKKKEIDNLFVQIDKLNEQLKYYENIIPMKEEELNEGEKNE